MTILFFFSCIINCFRISLISFLFFQTSLFGSTSFFGFFSLTFLFLFTLFAGLFFFSEIFLPLSFGFQTCLLFFASLFFFFFPLFRQSFFFFSASSFFLFSASSFLFFSSDAFLFFSFLLFFFLDLDSALLNPVCEFGFDEIAKRNVVECSFDNVFYVRKLGRACDKLIFSSLEEELCGFSLLYCCYDFVVVYQFAVRICFNPDFYFVFGLWRRSDKGADFFVEDMFYRCVECVVPIEVYVVVRTDFVSEFIVQIIRNFV